MLLHGEAARQVAALCRVETCKTNGQGAVIDPQVVSYTGPVLAVDHKGTRMVFEDDWPSCCLAVDAGGAVGVTAFGVDEGDALYGRQRIGRLPSQTAGLVKRAGYRPADGRYASAPWFSSDSEDKP